MYISIYTADAVPVDVAESCKACKMLNNENINNVNEILICVLRPCGMGMARGLGQKETVRDKQTVEPGNNANEQMCLCRGEQEGARLVSRAKPSDMLGLT